MSGTLSGKHILVTGAAQGLGLEIARASHQRGACVILVDVAKDRLADAATELGSPSIALECDLTDSDAVATLVEHVRDMVPDGLDALVNNAGVYTNRTIELTTPTRRSLAIAVNLVGTTTITEAIVESGVLRPDGGQVVFINSSAGDPLNVSAGAGEPIYAATKAGLHGYAKALEGRFKGSPRRVTSIFPGGMDTELYVNAGISEGEGRGQGWMMQPSDVAQYVAMVLEVDPHLTIGRLTIGPTL